MSLASCRPGSRPQMITRARLITMRWTTCSSGAAVVISAATLLHVVHLIVIKRDRVIIWGLLPGLQDAKDIVNTILYNLGLITKRPTFGMFSYAEKMEYWAFMWGTVVMAVTGLLLWAQK